jgi:hypothetical protein
MRASQKMWLAGGILAAAVPILAIEVKKLAAEAGAQTVLAPPPPDPASPDLDASAARPATYSNIYRYDYVGPEACAKCHTKNYESWRAHPHSKMNRNATAATVVGDFSGRSLTYGDARVVFSKGGGELTMTIFRGDKFVRQLRVTRTVGSRFVQMYIGVQSEGPELPDDAVYTREVKLPFSYWIARDEWFPESYDEVHEGPELDEKGNLTAAFRWDIPSKSAWQQVCIKCHNTYPYASRLEAAPDALLAGFPAADITLAKVVTKRRPAAQQWLLDQSELVTLGISCESCHFGGREHATKGASISFLPKSQDLSFPKATDALVASARQTPYVVNSICNQCHSAYPQAGTIYANGATGWNSREARDLAAGSCTSKIMCTTCHNPHEAGPITPGAAPSAAQARACVSCHEAQAKGHSQHGESVSCMDCHMPRIVHGLAGMLRSHRISSPSDPRMLRADQPNACNLCHLDRGTKWTVDQIAAKWARPIDLGGWSPPDDPVGPRWLRSKDALVRQVAVDAYSRAPHAALGDVVGALEDPSPPNRMFAVLAVERVLGRRIGENEYTPWAPPAERHRQAAALR